MADIIQGNWNDLMRREDLRGRRVQVIVMGEDQAQPENPWLKSLRAWADGHKQIAQLADDSRESIYSATVNDPR